MALSRKAREILNRQELIARRDMWFQRLRNCFEGRPDAWNDRCVPCVGGIVGTSSLNPYTEPERWVEDCLENLAERVPGSGDEAYFCPLCVEYGVYGVHYSDKILGADVFFQDGQWYNKYLRSPIGTLEAPDLKRDPVWALTERALRAFREAEVALPLFGLPTVASTLNVAVNLYGQEMLAEMLAEPENAAADLKTINDLLCGMHRRFLRALPTAQLQPVISWQRTQPPGYGQLCGCTTQLISAELYAGLVAPLDSRLLSVYPHGGMIHLCGAHAQHIPVFRSMPALKAVQLNDRAAGDLGAYYEGLREDQVIYLNPCREMSVDEALRITRGNRLVIAGSFSAPVSREASR